MGIVGRALTRSFGSPPNVVLHGLDLSIASGEFVSISGRSGSGKSTLLYLLSTLDRASSGALLIDERDTLKMGVEELHDFRCRQVGFVFQFHYLIPELSAIENILLAPMNLGQADKFRSRGLDLMKRCGLNGLEHRLPSQLSGGEQQRIAIARALVMRPRYVFADEPTGNLDTTNGEMVMSLLHEAKKEFGTTVVMVTHDPDFAAMADREIHLSDGRIVSRPL